jgi:hypothetical protein
VVDFSIWRKLPDWRKSKAIIFRSPKVLTVKPSIHCFRRIIKAKYCSVNNFWQFYVSVYYLYAMITFLHEEMGVEDFLPRPIYLTRSFESTASGYKHAVCGGYDSKCFTWLNIILTICINVYKFLGIFSFQVDLPSDTNGWH